MAGAAQAGAVPGRRGVFDVDEDAALAELEQAWAGGGYHGFCVLDGGLWSAISSSGEVLTGNTPDALDRAVRAHWQALQAAPASQRLSVAGIIAVGVVLMLFARFALRSPFFQIPRESASREP